MAHLIETGKLTLDDIKDAEKTLRALRRRSERENERSDQSCLAIDTVRCSGLAGRGNLLRNNRAQARYAVWLTASVKFLVPFAVLIDLGRQFGWVKLAAAPQTQARLYYALDEVSRRAVPQFTTSALPPAIATSAIDLPALLLIVWTCGFAAAGVRWWLSWRQVREAAEGARPFRLFDGIPVYSSGTLLERGSEPGVVGFIDQIVLVPEGIADRLTPQQLEAVLAHECCHARRRDNLAAAIHMFVEALFWFHPLVWWLGKRMMQERERACDEEVLRRTGDPEMYAEGILNVCRFYVESPLACVAGTTGSNLKRRIEEIMSRRTAKDLTRLRAALLVISGAATVLIPVGIGLIEAPATRAQTPPPTMSRVAGLQTSAEKKFEVATAKENRNSDVHSWRLGPPQHGTISIENLQLHRIIAS